MLLSPIYCFSLTRFVLLSSIYRETFCLSVLTSPQSCKSGVRIIRICSDSVDMTRRCSHCSHNGHNSRTCPNRGVKLFGVRRTDGSIRKSASMGNLSHYTGSTNSLANGSNSPSETPDHGSVADGYTSEDFVPGSSTSRERKKVVQDETTNKYILVSVNCEGEQAYAQQGRDRDRGKGKIIDNPDHNADIPFFPDPHEDYRDYGWGGADRDYDELPPINPMPSTTLDAYQITPFVQASAEQDGGRGRAGMTGSSQIDSVEQAPIQQDGGRGRGSAGMAEISQIEHVEQAPIQQDGGRGKLQSSRMGEGAGEALVIMRWR